MSKTKRTKPAPFKMFRCDQKRVFLLPPAAFKVWMYHFSREGTSRESWPSLETICAELDMAEKTVKRQRRALLAHGWLVKVGNRSTDSGKFRIPVMKVDEGVIPEGNFYPPVKPASRRVKVTPRTQGQSYPLDAGSKLPSEVYPTKQVYSKKQVHGLPKPFLKENGLDTEAETLGVKPVVPQGQSYPPVAPEDPYPALTFHEGRWEARRDIGRALTEAERFEMILRNTEAKQ